MTAGPDDQDAALIADQAARSRSPDLDDAPDDWGPDEGWDPPAHLDPIDVASPGLGLSARGLVVVSLAAVTGCAVVNLALTNGRITFFFDLCFVVVCLAVTMAVRRGDLFTAGVLPPLVFAAVIAGVAVAAPDAVTSTGGIDRVFLTGLADHAAGLVGGYAVALLAVAARMSATDPQRP